MSMFCYQCEQTAGCTGCTNAGVCGKAPEVAVLQDSLVYVTKGIGVYAHRAAQQGKRDDAIERFVLEALFATVTNVDFDPERLNDLIGQAQEVRQQAKDLYASTGGEEILRGPAVWSPGRTQEEREQLGAQVSIPERQEALGADLVGMQELILYGLKGAAAYADHAWVLGKTDPAINADFLAVLDFLSEAMPAMDDCVSWALKTGELNYKVMELLDAANTETYGHPEPTSVRVTPIKGKAILVSGHDLKDLAMLLEQTKDKGVNIYTHGEMLPCLAYPELKKYPHLAGNYGGAWQDQQKEFETFPGAILMTTNCIQKPRETYNARIFTTGLVAWPGVTHIQKNADGSKDFSAVIDAALAAPGFSEDEEEKRITIGFARNTVLSVADQVIEAVKSGAVRHFFLVGGCDGAKSGRNYYTEFAQKVPQDCMILTLACGKYRFNKLEFGEIGGIPRLLDIGQCNDAYSAIRIAVALAEAFDCEVNDLPLSLVLSWYEQKAVAILLTLLHLGIKNIRLGPSLPAFVTPPVLQVLVDTFQIAPITTPEEDLATLLNK